MDKFKHGGNVYKFSIENNIPIENIVDFSANINPLGISEKGKESFLDSIKLISHYPDTDYYRLKNVISKLNNVKEEEVFLGNGAIELIYKTFNIIRPNKTLIVSPSFVEYERALKTLNLKYTHFILLEEEEFILDIDKIINVVGEYELIVICSPNNPTGKLINKEEIIKLLISMGKSKLFIDESFIDFTDEKESLVSEISGFQNLFILRSLTKFYAIPGLRIGYLLTSNEVYRDEFYRSFVPWGINTVAYEVAISSLLDSEYIENTKKYINIERNRLINKLNMFKFIKVYSSDANFIFFKTLRDIDLENRLKSYGIMIRKCDNYMGLDKNFYRIAIKLKEQNNLLIDAFEEIYE